MATATSPSLLDAYNALFSNTTYGALLRKRVQQGLKQRLSTGAQMPAGTGGAGDVGGGGEQSGPGPGGGMPSLAGAPTPGAMTDPTAAGGVPGTGTLGSGVPGQTAVDKYGPAAEGLPAGWSPTSPASYTPAGWNSPMAREIGTNIFKYGSPVAGPVFAGAAALAGRGLASFAPHRYGPVPGWGMPRPTSTGVQAVAPYGGFNPDLAPGVEGGYAGYGGGGPDDRGTGGVGGGGSSGGGLGGGSGAEGPDPSSWG